MSAIQGYVQGALRKKELIASFEEHFKENHENKIESVSSSIFLNQVRSVSYYMGHVQDALWKKQLIASFIDHFKKIIQNMIYVVFCFIILN